MTIYAFSPDKNQTLIRERKISFEEIIAAIENDQVVDIVEHPNTQKYKHQMMYVVLAKDYVYLVPFVTNSDGNVFLKTIIPSRKAKAKYLKEGD